MHKYKLLFLPIETIPRELDPKLLIATKSLQKGFGVIIGSKNSTQKIAELIGSGIFYGKDHSPLSYENARKLHEKNLSFVAQDEEGLVWHTETEYLKRLDQRVLNLASAIFTWGGLQSDLINSYMESENVRKNVFETGSPRIEILKGKYLDYQELESDRLSINTKGIILINAAFTAGNWNPLMYGTSSYVEHYKSRGKINSDADKIFYENKSKYVARILEHYKILVSKLSSHYPSKIIVIRPHPDENHETYKKLSEQFNNVYMRYEGSMSYWANLADVVIHTGCTTGLEAWIMGRNVIRYNPELSDEFEPFLPNSIGMSATNTNEVIDIIERNADCVNRNKVDENILKKYIANVSSESDGIVNVLNQIAIDDKLDFKFEHHQVKDIKNKIKLSGLSLRFALSKIKRSFLNNHEEVAVKSQKFGKLSRSEIERKIRNLQKIDGNQKEIVEVNRIADDCYLISKYNSK